MNFESLTEQLPSARLSTDPETVAAYAGDWSSQAILKSLRGALTPLAAVLRPASGEDVAAALKWASDTGTAVVAVGGGSGVSGGTVTGGGELVIDMRAMNQVIDLDDTSGIVHVQAGVLGTDLEAWLNERGHTLGHFPQSVGLSTVGGWIAARSAGQLSSGYGAVEDFTVALAAALPDGTVASSRVVPRTAAGPQIHELMLGSEGTMGVVTEAWLRVRRAPAARLLGSLVFESFAAGLEGVRRLAQSGALPECVRVYDPGDTTIVFRALEPAPEGSVGIVVVEGDEVLAPARFDRAMTLAGGATTGLDLAGHWWEHRNDAVDTYRRVLSGELLGPDVAADTMEVSGIWSRIPDLYAGVKTALEQHCEMVGCHCSHAYETGCALYYTFLVRSDDREAALMAAWKAALDAAVEAAGTITHHHGVGKLKNPWLGREMDGFAPYLGRIQKVFDPAGVMNPGTLRA